MRLLGPFELPSKLLSIATSPCQLVYGKACHLPVKVEHKPLWLMKLLNTDASVVALKTKYQLLVLVEYRFHAHESARLYKMKASDARAVVKFIP